MEQFRSFDFVSLEHDILMALGGTAMDVFSGTAGLPVVGGLVATQTSVASMTINLAAGRIYQMASADAVSVGAIAQDLTQICQQGNNAGQALTLVAPSSGQSQWNLVQGQFSQVDAVRANDPNGGIVPFYNAANPTVPLYTSVNTVRQGLFVVQVIQGAPATTGSEVPPTPTNGWTPLYLIDLAGGQTTITTPQILKAGPSVGTGVPTNYPSAPFIAGLMASHHGGKVGQAPKINLGTETQGTLPYAQMSPVRTLLTSSLTLYVNSSTGNDSNSGTTAGSPFLTIQAAINAMYHNYDFNGNNCTISVANGTYNYSGGANKYAAVFNGKPVGLEAPISFVGNVGSPGSVTIAASGSNGVLVQGGAIVNMSGFTVSSTGSNQGLLSFAGYGINSASGALIYLANCVIGSCGSVQVQANQGATIALNGPVTLTGSTLWSLVGINTGTVYSNSQTITVTGLTVTNAFAYGSFCGSVQVFGGTFVGSATGPRYSASLGGNIFTNNGGATYLPGSTAGSTSLGGEYY